MVRKVEEYQKIQMKDDIDREVKNMKYCVNPAISNEQEAKFMKEREKNMPRGDQIWFKLRKIKYEATLDGPIPLSDHYRLLLKTDTWQK